MDDWRPDLLAHIALKQGIPCIDLRPPQERWASASDGVRLHILDWGGEGHSARCPDVLLLHGGALTAQTWDYVCLALRARYRLTALDLRGHGASEWSSEYPIERHVADIGNSLDALEISRAHIVGMSLGGVAGAEFVAANPSHAISLTLVDVAPGVVFEKTARMRGFVTTARHVESIDAAVALARRAAPWSDPERLKYRMLVSMRPGADGGWVWKRDDRRPTDFEHILDHVERLGECAAAIEVPFLLARGARSRILPRAAAQRFAAQFPNGRVCEIAEAGHNVQEDNPRVLAELLAAFWASAPPPAESLD